MFWSFPTGLVIYWLVNNLLAIGQQMLYNRKTEGARSCFMNTPDSSAAASAPASLRSLTVLAVRLGRDASPVRRMSPLRRRPYS